MSDPAPDTLPAPTDGPRPGRLEPEAVRRWLLLLGLYAGVAALGAIALQLGALTRSVGYLADDATVTRLADGVEGVAAAVKDLDPPARASAAERSMVDSLFQPPPADPVASAIREQTRQMQAEEANRRRERILSPD